VASPTSHLYSGDAAPDPVATGFWGLLNTRRSQAGAGQARPLPEAPLPGWGGAPRSSCDLRPQGWP